MRQVPRRVHTALLGSLARLRRAWAVMVTASDPLEAEVAERDAWLVKANEQLHKQIHEREAARAELARLGSRVRLILDSTSDGIYGLDGKRCISFANRVAAGLMGRSSDELIGRPQHELVCHRSLEGRDCSEGGCAIEQVIDDGLTRSGTCELLRGEDGSVRIEYVSVPVRTGLDVTGCVVALRECAEEASELEGPSLRARELRVAASGIAHDFGNLLAVILGQTSLALEALPPESGARSHLERAAVATRRAADVARQFLVQAGLDAREARGLELNDVVRENVGLFREAIPAAIELRTELADDLPPVDADPGQMQQLVMNLILNAAEAIGESAGTITLSTGTKILRHGHVASALEVGEPLAPGRYVTLTVEDTGTGMEAESLAKIFDPRFTTKTAGRGVGLATVLGVLRAHRGGVEVESELGRGTAFRLLLPEGRGRAEAEVVR